MGIRESLLNTITSVGNGDFVRIVTSAGASSKATVANLFKSFESGLSAKSSLTTSDYIRVVGSDDVSYKQLVSDVAKKVIENYTGSSLGGSARSVKTAVDNLYDKIQYHNAPANSSITLDYGAGTRTLLTIVGGGDSSRGQYIVAGYTNTLEWKTILATPQIALSNSGTRSLVITNNSAYAAAICITVYNGTVTKQ